MRPDIVHLWSCDGEHFEDDDALARYVAARIEAGEDRVMFAREGCMFRLVYEEEEDPAAATPPQDAFRRRRTYIVTLLTNSPTCIAGNVFTDAWPRGYRHGPVQAVAKDAPPDAQFVVDGTMNEVGRLLAGMGSVLWPERHDR